MNFIKKKHLILFFIYALLISVLLFRINVHVYHYTTPDSLAYLRQSNLILNHWKECSFVNLFEIKQGFTIWPIGYPLIISIISFLTGFSVLISSKISTFIFLGLSFTLLSYWFKNKTWFLAFSFFSYGSLEVLSQTWSETPFIFFVLFLTFIISNEKKFSNIQIFFIVSLVLIILFLIRYVGVIYYVFISIIALIKIIKGEKKKGLYYLGTVSLSSIIVITYLYQNFLISGYSTGINRISLGHQEPWLFGKYFFQGIFNEFSIARNYFFDNKSPDLLFIILLSFQLLIIIFIIFKKIQLKHSIQFNDCQKLLFQISGIYLVGIIILKAFIPIDKFDYRILFPFTLPLTISLFSWLIEEKQKIFWKHTHKPIIIFMIISLLANLPKNYLLQLIKEHLL